MIGEQPTGHTAADLAALGTALQREFFSFIGDCNTGWLDAQLLSGEDWRELSLLEAELQLFWRPCDDLLVLEAWLTSGFIPAGLAAAQAMVSEHPMLKSIEASPWLYEAFHSQEPVDAPVVPSSERPGGYSPPLVTHSYRDRDGPSHPGSRASSGHEAIPESPGLSPFSGELRRGRWNDSESGLDDGVPPDLVGIRPHAVAARQVADVRDNAVGIVQVRRADPASGSQSPPEFSQTEIGLRAAIEPWAETGWGTENRLAKPAQLVSSAVGSLKDLAHRLQSASIDGQALSLETDSLPGNNDLLTDFTRTAWSELSRPEPGDRTGRDAGSTKAAWSEPPRPEPGAALRHLPERTLASGESGSHAALARLGIDIPTQSSAEPPRADNPAGVGWSESGEAVPPPRPTLFTQRHSPADLIIPGNDYSAESSIPQRDSESPTTNRHPELSPGTAPAGTSDLGERDVDVDVDVILEALVRAIQREYRRFYGA